MMPPICARGDEKKEVKRLEAQTSTELTKAQQPFYGPIIFLVLGPFKSDIDCLLDKYHHYCYSQGGVPMMRHRLHCMGSLI